MEENKMKIYNADSTNMEQVVREMTNEDQLLELVAMQKDFIKMLIEQKESLQRDYAIFNEFLENNEDLHEHYVAHLKGLKKNPDFQEHLDEIETCLVEFGADEASERYFDNYRKAMKATKSLTDIESDVLNHALENDKIQLAVFDNLTNSDREVSGIEVQEFVRTNFSDEYDEAAKQVLGDWMQTNKDGGNN
jgi:hypothetical protein